MKKVIVTGAAGYVGSHVCKLLKEHGHTVFGFDNFFHGEYNDVSFIDKFWKQDLTTDYLCDEADAVIHLGGRSVVPQSLKEPSEYYRVNTTGTENCLNKLQTDNFIFASTSSAFEMASPYARSKVAAEDIIKEKSSGYTIFRFFNVSGTDGLHRQLGVPSHLIRMAAMVATGSIPYLKIYGTDYPTRDGTCIRDYIHVRDLSAALVRAVDQGAQNTPYEALGSNKGWSVLDVVHAMEKATGKQIKTKIVERRPGDAVASIVDNLSHLCKLDYTIEDMCLDQYKLELNRV